MLESLMILGAIAAVYYVIYWSIQHDRVQDPSAQTGLLRMRPPAEAPDVKAGDTAHGGSTRSGRRRTRHAADAATPETGETRVRGARRRRRR
jgi:hypothetical protein